MLIKIVCIIFFIAYWVCMTLQIQISELQSHFQKNKDSSLAVLPFPKKGTS